MITLLQYLQQQGFSRRAILAMMQQGNIFVNAERVDALKYPLSDGNIVTYDTQTFSVSEDKKDKRLILFNKPKGYVVSKSDPHNATIYEILPSAFQDYYYIGRLDKESRGLLLLTNDPALVHQYEHPKFGIEKEYLIQLSSPLTKENITKTKIGIRVPEESGKTKEERELLKLKDIVPTSLPNQYKVTLSEGKKRHIRRVIKALGYELLDLQRIKEGEYLLADLPEGQRKELPLD